MDNGTGNATKFNRVDDVCRLEVLLLYHDAYGVERSSEVFSRRET